MSRIESLFAHLKNTRPALVSFVTAGDPDYDNSLTICESLIRNGADIIELGMPFTDPMADGPVIQASALRALKNGQNMCKTLQLVRDLRNIQMDNGRNKTTPIVLMGYYNPIYIYGVDQFVQDAVASGVDGLIIVDLPAEHDDELCNAAEKAGIHFIRLLTPTTVDDRLQRVLQNASGFLYYVSVAGVTGAHAPNSAEVEQKVAAIRAQTELPICVGFGIKTAEQIAEIGAFSEGVVVGSAFVNLIDDVKSSDDLRTEIGALAAIFSAALPVSAVSLIDDYVI